MPRSEVERLLEEVGKLYGWEKKPWGIPEVRAILRAGARMRKDHYPQGDEPSAAAKAWDRAKARLLRG